MESLIEEMSGTGRLININNTNEDIDVKYEIDLSQEYVNADTHDGLSKITTIKRLSGKLISLNKNVIIPLGNHTLENSNGKTYKIIITRYDLQTRNAFFKMAA